MNKIKKTEKTEEVENQENYHPDPRNDIEKFLSARLPAIIKAYGLGNIRFNFLTKGKENEDEDIDIPEGGLLAIKYHGIYKVGYIFITANAVQLYKNKEYKILSDGLVHEVGHILTDRLMQLAKRRHATQQDIDETVEETTESIAQIVRNLLALVDPMFKV